MKKYLLKRILFSIFSLIVVTGTVMILVYSLMDRSLILMSDDTYQKRTGGDKVAYAYSRYQEYGYIYYEQFPNWLNKKIDDPSSPEYVAAINATQKTVGGEFPDNPYCVEFVQEKQKDGYKVEWIKPIYNTKGVLTSSGYLLATRDKNIFVRLGEYFANFFYVDTIWSVNDPNLPASERYVRWEWDPYSNMPALVGNGTKNRYLIYFDNQFPFIHQNIISINLGKSRSYRTDTTNVLLARTGEPVTEDKVLPKDLYTNPDLVSPSDLDFHKVTYSETISPFDENIYGAGNHYVNAVQYKDGFTRMGNSFVIGIIATVLAYFVGLPIGIWMARKKDRLPDKIGNAYIIFIIAVPSLAYIYIFSAIGTNLFQLPLKWQYVEDHSMIWIAFILPIISLALPSIGGLMRWTRRFMIDQENSDYVKFARSQGLTEREIFSQHIFRNAMIFLVHGIPIDIMAALTGAIVTERVYGVPGVGGLLTDAINKYDNGVIVAAAVFYTTLSIVALLLGDLLLAKYDPRVSFTNERG